MARAGDSRVQVVNVATGLEVRVCAVTGAVIPPEVLAAGEDRVRGWLLIHVARNG